MIHPVKIGRENGGFASAGAGPNFDDRVAIFIFIRGQQSNLQFSLELGHALFQVRDFIIGHGCDLHVPRTGQLAIVVELFARSFQFIPLRQHTFGTGMLAHDFLSTLAIIEQLRIGDLALEFLEPFAFALNERLKVHLRM